MASLIAHLRMPLYGNAYALMLSTGLSSALGIVYWVLAARYYTLQAVGLNAALISGMIFLSGVAQMNLMSAMTRFLPVAGRTSLRLVGGSYLLSLVASAILGLGAWQVLAVFGVVPPSANPSLIPLFALATMVWSLFSLQDNVLTGLQQTIWVPIENIAYAIAKLVLLIGLAPHMPDYGIFASWIIPVGVSLLPINWLIFKRFIPLHVLTKQAQAVPLHVGRIARFVAGNYLASLFALGSTRLLPVLVTTQVGADANAYFYLAWTIANSLKLIGSNMTASLTVEGAADGTTLARDGRHFLINLARLLIPVVLVIIVGAPLILSLSGQGYATQGATLLRLLALSVLPSMVTSLAISVAQVKNQVRQIIVIQAAFCMLVLGLGAWWLPPYGIVGVGAALLVSESVIACISLVTILRPLLQPAPRPVAL